MTVQDLTKKYGMSEVELYMYAFTNLKSFKNRETKKQTWKLAGEELRQLDWLLASSVQKKDEMPSKKEDKDDDWTTYDPTEDEPDDSEVPTPMVAPDDVEKELDINSDVPSSWEEEKGEMAARIEALQQELDSLRQTHLTMQSDTATKQTELLAKAIHEKQLAEAKIAVIKEDIMTVKHLSNVRIKELEERNAILEKQLKDAHIELNNTVENLIKSQHTIQEITDAANKDGAQQKLQLLDAQHQQDELYKAIHEKEIALSEEKEKTQTLMEKYNGALQRIGEIIRKIEKSRARMREISAEFDVYINDTEMTPEAEIVTAQQPGTVVVDNANKTKPELAATSLQPLKTPASAPLEVLGKPLTETQAKHHQEQVIPKPNIWRKIASFF